MDVLAVLLAGVGAALLAFTVFDLLFSEERRVKRRLAGLSAYERSQVADAAPVLKPFGERITRPLGSSLLGGLRALVPDAYVERLRLRLTKAGNPRGIEVSGLLTYKAVCAVVAYITCVFVYGLFRGFGGGVLFGSLVAAVVGFFVPDIALWSAVNKRQLAVRRALPDMLDMLTISVEAGLGFDQAVAKLVANSHGPLAEEFARMLQEIQAGIPRTDAYRHLAERTDVPEVSTFVTSMVQADVFGISVSNVLRSQAKEMRVKRRQRAEEIAQKAPVKIVFPLVLCILPATLIVVLGPALVSIGRAFGLIP
ncbi:MAG: secretion system protein [Actinobacteria bacterium HGW-Actinobacteria-6]|nr:MAG: secretion system protein [Actinobacteria bacterium HGW-Actinobacteria-6]